MPIKLNGSTSGYTQVNAAAVAANNTLVLPTTGTTLLSDTFTGNVALTGNATITGNETVSGNVTVSGDLIPSSSFMRNRIINGAMQISQRTAVNTNVAVGTGTSGTFGPDRYFAYTGTTSLWNTSQVSTGASDFPYANRLQRISGQTSTSAIYWRQIVESVNCTDLSGQSVVLSFYATAGANYSGGAVTAQVYTGTGTDQGAASLNTAAWTGFATPISSTFTPTTTRTRYTFTGTIGSGINELAISLTWSGSGTAGTNDYVDITGVQLEVGSNATPFERRLYGTEFMLCQRYYYRISSGGVYTQFAIGTCTTSTGTFVGMPLPVTMRATPTAIDTAAAGNFLIFDGAANVAVTTLAIYSAAPNSLALQTVNPATLTQTRPAMLESNGGSAAYIGVTAEL
jgi:hypothetical protein